MVLHVFLCAFRNILPLEILESADPVAEASLSFLEGSFRVGLIALSEMLVAAQVVIVSCRDWLRHRLGALSLVLSSIVDVMFEWLV